MAEQHAQTSDYSNRWRFTGHELDRETGLYYAGARYVMDLIILPDTLIRQECGRIQ